MLARQSGASRRTIERLFSQETGLTVAESQFSLPIPGGEYSGENSVPHQREILGDNIILRMSPLNRFRSTHAQQSASRRVHVLEIVLQIRHGNKISAVFHQSKKLLPFRFRAFAFGDVLCNDQRGGLSGVIHRVQENIHIDRRSVL